MPPELMSPASISDTALADAMAYFRVKGSQRGAMPSLDDPFVGGLTYREYFALTDDEADAVWSELAAGAPTLEELPV
ncbi:MAG: hypothetical protein KIT87_25340, partial [Anaerolineae bacterium]|nr:hypothetical protein [Anaerolineae bacterium]